MKNASPLLRNLVRQAPRYGIAVVAVGVSCLLRIGLVDVIGTQVPYITFLPAVMLTALLAGFGPGLFATLLSALFVEVWVLPPVGRFEIASTSDAVGLAIFCCASVLMCTVARFYHHAKARLAAYEVQAYDRADRDAKTPPAVSLAFDPALSFRKRLLFDATLTFVLAGLIAIGCLAYRDMNEASVADRRMTQSDQIIEYLGGLLSSLNAAETGQRGYIITGDSRYLDPYNASLGEIESYLGNLRRLTADDSPQKERIDAISSLVAAKLAELKKVIDLRRTNGFQAASDEVMTHLGRNIMAKLRALIDEARGAEENLLQSRIAAKEQSTLKTVRSVCLSGVLGGVLVLLLFGSLKQELAHRAIAENELRSHRDHLEELVATRTKDLEFTNAELKSEIDISARAMAALREGEEKLRLFTEHAPAAIAMLDSQMRYIATSRRWLVDYGIEDQDLRGRSHYDVFPSIPERWKEIHRRCLAGAVDRSEEDRLEREDGTTQWLRWEIRPWHLSSGAVGGIIVFSEDITERRRFEERLLLQSAALQSAANAIAITDSKGNIQWINNSFTRLTGYSSDEVIGSNPRALKSGKHDRAFYQDMWETIIAGRVWHGTLVNKRKDGSLYTEEMTITPVLNNGAITHFIAIKQDVTDRQRAEEEIRTLNAELADRVRARTAQLQAANQELEAFCYSVSHDLRAPLRGINGFSQALMEDCADKLDEAGKGYLDRICDSCRRMAQLIDDLLNLSRLSRTEMHLKPVDFSQMASEIVYALRETDPARNVEVKVAEGVTAIGDPALLRVVLFNLLANAWKFTSKSGEAMIEFGARDQDEQLVYFVRDNGAGFDMSYADKLFKPFQRLHGMKEFPGTGIGLANVARVIRRHGGRVWAEAAVGKGATFCFTLEKESKENGES